MEQKESWRVEWISVFQYFGHMERMDEDHMARIVLMAEVSECWMQCRLGLHLIDGVDAEIINRGMMVVAV